MSHPDASPPACHFVQGFGLKSVGGRAPTAVLGFGRFWDLAFRDLGFRDLGFWDLEFWDLGFGVLAGHQQGHKLLAKGPR